MRRFGLIAVAAALLAGPPAAVAASQPVGSGSLDWGVKESFRDYITGPIAVGSIVAGDGATRNDDGTFRWPLRGGSFDADAGTGEVRSRGTVRFSGHGGVLDVTITDPRPVFSGHTGILYADVKSRSQDDGQIKSYPNVDLASLDLAAVTPSLSAAGFRYEAIPATLTENGSPAFGGFYDPGEPMDPVTVEAAFGASEPVFESPRLKVPGKAQRVGDDRQARVARVVCPTGPCTVAAAKRVKVEIGDARHRLRVRYPKTIGEGTAEVTVKLRRAALRDLEGKRARVELPITLTAGDETLRDRIEARIKAPLG